MAFTLIMMMSVWIIVMTYMIIMMQDIEQYLVTENKKEAEVVNVRLENIKLKNKLKKKEQQLKSKVMPLIIDITLEGQSWLMYALWPRVPEEMKRIKHLKGLAFSDYILSKKAGL